MAIKDLKEVYQHMLQDQYSANKQALDMTTKLGRAAESKAVSEALIAGTNGISQGMDEVSSLCSDHGIDPTGAHCKGMEGLVNEAKAHAIDEEFGDSDARDAMIIAQYQRLVHYAIAGYGTLAAYANRLDLDGDAAVLKKCLDETYDGDRRMTDIATDGGVNAAAAT